MVTRSDSSFRIFPLVLAIAFGVVALAVGYVAVKNSTEDRSHAAIGPTKDYISWNFSDIRNKWKATKLGNVIKDGKTLTANIMNGFTLTSPDFNVTIPAGNKYVVFRVAAAPNEWGQRKMKVPCTTDADGSMICPQAAVQGVTTTAVSAGVVSSAGGAAGTTTIYRVPPVPVPTGDDPYPCAPRPVCKTGQACPEPAYYPLGGWCQPGVTPKPTPRIARRYITLSVHYTPTNTLTVLNQGNANGRSLGLMKRLPESVVTTTIPVDGSYAIYTLKLPEIGAVTLTQISFVVNSGAVRGDSLVFDYVKLTGPQSSPCVQPPVCATEGTVDKTGRRIYCALDAKPGVTYCNVTPKPSCVTPPTCNVGLVKGTDGFYRCPTVDLKPGVTYCPYPVPSCTPLPPCATEGTIGPNGQRIYCSMPFQAGVNYCNLTKPTPIPANCRYVTVQCIKAPCPQQIVCTSPVPKPPVYTTTPTPNIGCVTVCTDNNCHVDCNPGP